MFGRIKFSSTRSRNDKKSILNLDKSIANVTKERPKLRAFIDGLEKEREQKRETIKGIEAEIDGIYYQEQEAQRIKDLNSRRARVVGRISLWVESVETDTDSEKQEQIIKNFRIVLVKLMRFWM